MKEKEQIKGVALVMAQAAFDKKGQDISIMDLEGISLLSDYFVLVTANNVKNAQAIAEFLKAQPQVEALEGMTVLHREGYREGEWVLLDFGDIIVHVFGGQDYRDFYGLEQLWSDAKYVDFEGK
mgnify:CR=1 FL=1